MPKDNPKGDPPAKSVDLSFVPSELVGSVYVLGVLLPYLEIFAQYLALESLLPSSILNYLSKSKYITIPLDWKAGLMPSSMLQKETETARFLFHLLRLL